MLNSVFRHFVLLAILLAVPGCSYFAGAETEDEEEFADFDTDKKVRQIAR